MLITDIKRAPVEQVLLDINSKSKSSSIDAGKALVEKAADVGLSVRNYLDYAIDTRQGENAHFGEAGLSGYEAAKAYLSLPVKDDFKNGVALEAAAESFQTFPGVRAMFPEVMDDVVRWKYRPTQFEQIDRLVGNSRTISQTEMISTIVDDNENDYDAMREISEGARIPVYSIRAGQQSVRMFKHGMGWRTTYEFNRRARLDIMTPYAIRAIQHADRSKVAAATDMLINGDGVQGAAPVVAQSSLVSGSTTNGTIDRAAFRNWLVERAKVGYPIDTVVGNWDAYLAWLDLFGLPRAAEGPADDQILARQGFQIEGAPSIANPVRFAVSSTAPANRLIGFSQGDTLEELVEANSLISESEQSITNQTITYVRTETTGYKLVFGDTRSIFNFGA